MRLAIGIATRGRAAILAEVLAELRRQTRGAGPRSSSATSRPRISARRGPASNTSPPRPGCRGSATPSSTPRRIATWCCSSTTTSSPAPEYCAVTEAVFAARPAVVVTTGTVLADGANAPGSLAGGRPGDPGRRPLRRRTRSPPRRISTAMAATWPSAWRRCGAHGIRVDESLPALCLVRGSRCHPPARPAWRDPAAGRRARRASRGEARADAGPAGSAIRRSPTRSTSPARAPIPGTHALPQHGAALRR